MPTKKPIISVVLDDELLEKVDDYRFENRISSRSKALQELIKKGIISLEDDDKENEGR